MSKRSRWLAVVLVFAAAPALADGLQFRADLSGAEEVPVPVATDTTGRASFAVDRSLTRMRYKLEIRRAVDILAVAGAHIHCAPVGSNGPVAAFLAGMAPPSGYSGRVVVRASLTDANVIPTACGSTIAELVDAFFAGQAYVNVHSGTNPGGEVRGQIEPVGGDDSDSDSSSD